MEVFTLNARARYNLLTPSLLLFLHLFLLDFIPLSLRERGINETRSRIGLVFSVRPYSIFLNLRSFSLVVSAMI
jgi:hypothetical protein